MTRPNEVEKEGPEQNPPKNKPSGMSDKTIPHLEQQNQKLRKTLKEIVKAIKNGEKIKDERGIVYEQQFGEALLEEAQQVLNNENY